MAGDAGQLLVGAVHDGALAAAPVRAHEVHEALAAEPAAVIFRAWGAKEGVSASAARAGAGLWAVGTGRAWSGGTAQSQRQHCPQVAAALLCLPPLSLQAACFPLVFVIQHFQA